MSKIIIKPAKKINGIIEVPGDKSISHRAVIIGSIAEGTTEVKNFLMGEDCLRTMDAFKTMGINIKSEIRNPKSEMVRQTHHPSPSDHPELSRRTNSKFQNSKVIIEGKGLRGLKKPQKELYLGNSGTTMRLILGILAGQNFECVLTGDESLSKRPMKRVAEPLRMMGADINPKSQDIYPPLKIRGKYPLKAIKYKLPIASAQVKSAILLAGLYADGITEVEEPLKSRDHTERMLKNFGGSITIDGLKVSIEKSILKGAGEIFVPSDISSAAFFMVAALILKSSKIIFKNLGINPTRTGIIDILKNMGARIEISNFSAEGKSTYGGKSDYFEPIADVTVYSSNLKGTQIEGEVIPRAIDELPVIMVAAVFSEGLTVIKGAYELRVKETDRIASMVTNLTKMGADIKAEGDNIIINGRPALKGAEVDSFGDHRTAMGMVVAGLCAEGKTTVLNTDCINKSFPEFEDLLNECVDKG